jgi:hypothetical protein
MEHFFGCYVFYVMCYVSTVDLFRKICYTVYVALKTEQTKPARIATRESSRLRSVAGGANEFQSQFPPICDWNSLASPFSSPTRERVKNKNKKIFEKIKIKN